MLKLIKSLFFAKPNAAKAWQTSGLASSQATGQEAGSAYWLFAAPVHLQLQRDSFSLSAPVPLMLEIAEVEALTNTLNKHFMQDGKQFFWHQNTWFLRLAYNPQIETSAPDLAINQDISAYLPKGAGAMAWATFQNELQMLFFEHPVNVAREANKLPAINSIWCYGGGQLINQQSTHAN